MPTGDTRAEHMRFCKQRAIEYLDRGDIPNALASFTSDLSKHPETENLVEGPMAGLLAGEAVLATQRNDVAGFKRFIEGYAE